MPLDVLNSIAIIEIMEPYIARIRPRPEIRDQVDVTYEIEDQSVTLKMIRPDWKNPSEKRAFGYARATYVKKDSTWKIYWLRADGKWHAYRPSPVAKSLPEFLRIVEQDAFGCFSH